MSRRALAWTAVVVLPLAAVAVVFAVTGWPWRFYPGIVVGVLVMVLVAYWQDDMVGRHAVDEGDWDEEAWMAYLIEDLERRLASGDTAEDFAPPPARPADPPDATPTRHRGVFGRIIEHIRRIDWSDDRGGAVGPPTRREWSQTDDASATRRRCDT